MTEREVRVSVRVFREPGALLARMAHDVELVLERVTARAVDRRVEVAFEPASLRVTGALVDGRVAPALLDAGQRQEIERNVQAQVLKTDRFPRGSFAGEFDESQSPVSVRGTLELCGKRQPISFELIRQGQAHVGELTITPSRWGIAPYRALLGALKLQDKAVIRVEVKATP
ncbi:MAG TPA: YceI family protein [Polyangiaceae bacterium]